MADLVYGGMSPPGQPAGSATPPAPQAQLAATALHAATLELRAQYPANPIIWAAHVHSGA
jgi:hypothetical protein